MERPTSMREYVDKLRVSSATSTRSIARSTGAWNSVMIASRCYETAAPAPLFTNVKDVAPGFSAPSATFGESSPPGLPLARIALAVGLQPDANVCEIISKLVAARDHGPVPQNLVENRTLQREHLARRRSRPDDAPESRTPQR